MLFVNISQAPFIIGLIITLIGIIIISAVRRQKIIRLFFSSQQQKLISQQTIKSMPVIKLLLLILATVMIGISLLDPRGRSVTSEVQLQGMDIIFVYDVSRSMDVVEEGSSRLQTAKSLGEQLITSLTGNRVGLVAFAATPLRLLPLTIDLSTVNLFIQELSSDMIGSQSTDIGAALQDAITNFSQDTLTHKAIILFSDGENLDGSLQSSLSQMKELGISLFVIGTGSEEGGAVPVYNPQNNQTYYLTDGFGNQIISKANLSYLEKLANDANGSYYDGTRANMINLNNRIDSIEKSPFGSNTQNYLEPQFRLFIGIAILALLLFLFLPDRQRKSLALLIFFLLISQQNFALSNKRKAYSSYQNGDYSSALRFFQRQLVNRPEDEKSKFGEASTLYKLERGERAENAFLALTNSENTKIAQQATYNTANARVQKNDLQGALELYKKVLSETDPDSSLYQKSMTNYLYTRALEQQQQQQDQQDQNGQGQDNSQQSQGQNQQDQQNQNEQNSDSQQNNPNQQDTQNGQNSQQNQDEQSGQQAQDQQNAPSQSITSSDIDNLLGIAEKSEKENFSRENRGEQGLFQQNRY